MSESKLCDVWALALVLALAVGSRAGCPHLERLNRMRRSTGVEGEETVPVFQGMVRGGMDPEKAAALLLTPGKDFMCTNTSVTPECNSTSPFRTMNGICNNLNNPFWGAPYLPLARVVPPAYEDGLSVPRGGLESRLPNPRLISNIVHPDHHRPDKTMSNMVAQVAQFFAHDLSFSPEPNHICCGIESKAKECWPIQISSADYFYGPLNQSCMSFSRSTPYCKPGPGGLREQMNMVTSFIDGSHIYGYDDTHAAELREHRRGRLMTNNLYKDFLPFKDQITHQHGPEALHDVMGDLMSGDHRTNVLPGLTALHILFMREHNRIAAHIFHKDQNMDDELIFQHTRRILVAEWQRIVFAELLPIMLSVPLVASYGLDVGDSSSTFTSYNQNLDPRMFQGFIGGAFRFGQTLVNGVMLMARDTEPIAIFKTRNSYFNNNMIRANSGEGYELILSGLMLQYSQSADRYLSEDLTNYMWMHPNRTWGDDLAARNIQRARDHGIPSYNTYRKYCGLQGLTSSWDSPPREISLDNWQKLKQAYEHPDDIDLYPGGLSESPVKDALPGPTFACLIAEQLQRVKFGDRFFYTHKNQAGSFTSDQLVALNKLRFGDLICLNSDLKRTPLNVFRPISEANPWVDCKDETKRRFIDISMFI